MAHAEDSKVEGGQGSDKTAGAAPSVLRDKATLLSFDSDRRAYDVADRLARRLIGRLITDGHTASETLRLARRHPEAARFLALNDFAGVLRPLVDALEVGQGDPHLPFFEIVARRALSEIRALEKIWALEDARAPRTVVTSDTRSDTLRFDETRPRIDVADASSKFSVSLPIAPHVVLEVTEKAPAPASPLSLLRAYRLLRSASVPPALSLLLSRATHRIVAGRLARMATMPFSDLYLSPAPAVYWCNMSLRAVFHASERRARGLPTVAAFTILVSDHPRYKCDVFDETVTVGTGQLQAGSRAYRLAGVLPPATTHAPLPRRALIALQPAIEVLDALVGFVGLGRRAHWALSVKHHPSQQRNVASLMYWERMVGRLPEHRAGDGDASQAHLIITGTSTYAVAACLEGHAVILACSQSQAAALWGTAPAPGLFVDPARLAGVPPGDEADFLERLLGEAEVAVERFRRHYAALPLLPTPRKSDS